MPDEIEWTTDMNIELPKGVRNSDVADCVAKLLLQHDSFPNITAALIDKFQLSESDAYLALERSQGGIIRALTGNLINRPDGSDDPIALHAFQLVWNTLPKKSLFKKKTCGRHLGNLVQ